MSCSCTGGHNHCGQEEKIREERKTAPFKKTIMNNEKDLPDAKVISEMSIRVAVVRTQWHETLTQEITGKYVKHLNNLGITNDQHVVEIVCPGCWEIPYVVSQLLLKGFDAIICFGILIEGETKHFDLIAESVTTQLMKTQCKSGIPIINAIFCCHNQDQAVERTTGAMSTELAKSLAITTISMANIKRTIPFMALK